jgi:hypothetical protein
MESAHHALVFRNVLAMPQARQHDYRRTPSVARYRLRLFAGQPESLVHFGHCLRRMGKRRAGREIAFYSTVVEIGPVGNVVPRKVELLVQAMAIANFLTVLMSIPRLDRAFVRRRPSARCRAWGHQRSSPGTPKRSSSMICDTAERGGEEADMGRDELMLPRRDPGWR